mgnify:CR=1 FL=1
MINVNYNSFKKVFLFFALFSFSFSQNNDLVIELKNGNKISGELLLKTDSTYTLKTEFGELVIPNKDISVVSDGSITNNSKTDKKPSFLNSYLMAKQKQISLNQQARWRSIYGTMLAGNILYGAGIPYLLDLDQTAEQYVGFRLLVFAASYSLSSGYTRNMDLPIGRSYLQYAGASLGFFSIAPIVSFVGLDNWKEFDPDSKIALTYTMVSVPYGALLADRAYSKWNLSNGQSFLISLGINLGTLNTVGAIQQTDWDRWSKDNPENFARWTTSLVYAGALLGGKYAKDIALKSPSISEGDVAFLNTSMGLGYLNSILLGYAMDLNHYKDQTMLSLAGINGFLFLANNLNKKYGSLSQGQENIVSLGVGSAYFAWLGIAMLTQYDYKERSARYIDVATLTAGWYFSRKNVGSDLSSIDNRFKRKNDLALRINPIMINQNKNLIPGVSVNLIF